ncbi:hypothetical protein E2C01_030125 [Portunus trituberculatus]|uniref:Uncharacterized protein n=1 Tax=Portunus trituberculatus TaxID=210409 RepID=A0A5B7ETU8_PORTR|nr:hypothetical protein [Portunus trituberculatus]
MEGSVLDFCAVYVPALLGAAVNIECSHSPAITSVHSTLTTVHESRICHEIRNQPFLSVSANTFTIVNKEQENKESCKKPLRYVLLGAIIAQR